MAVRQRKEEATTVWLSNVVVPAGGAWATAARDDALARVTAMGLPTRRDEYWRYSDPAVFVADTVAEAAVLQADEKPVFGDVDRIKLIFVEGVFDADASDKIDLEGIEIEQLSDAASKDIHWAKDLYGVLETNGQNPVQRPLAALNTAIATNGVVIHVTGKVSKPISLMNHRRDTASDAMLHHLIKLEPGAEMTLLENGPSAARLSSVIEVDIADGAAFHHVRSQGRDHDRQAVTHLFARVGAQSTLKSFTLTVNGKLTRNEAVIEIVGDDAIAHVAGACVGDGGAFHHDDTVFVTHDAVGCESRQVFKKVLRNGATGVFQGKILVKKDAQKTDGYQISQSLLLDEDSQFLAKPELEIYADDVICSHGSTSGAIDEDAMFYLRSRGVPEREATNLLTLAFLAESLDEIADPALADDLRDRLDGWLVRHS